MDAGFDGVAVHAANGYLIDQFMRDSSKLRDDAWGSSFENRTRLLLEVVSAVARAVGNGRTGVRLSSVTPTNDAHDSSPQPLFERAGARLAPLALAYLHVIEGATGGARDIAPFDYEALRHRFDGRWMVNNGYTQDRAAIAVARGEADLVTFGRPFIANSNRVHRLRIGAALNRVNPATLYGGRAEGYADYRTVAQG